MGSTFSSAHIGGAPVIDMNSVSVAVGTPGTQGLSKTGQRDRNLYTVLQAGQCLVDEVNRYQGQGQTSNTVSIYFSQQARYIELCPQDWPMPSWYRNQKLHLRSAYNIKLGHNVPQCNAVIYNGVLQDRHDQHQLVLGRNYKAACCIVCQDSEGRFFITRRNRNMKFFPRAWVFPGGHIEVDEGLDEGALREFFEETGVEVKTVITADQEERKYTYQGHQIEVTPFYAFESTTMCDLSDPRNPKPPKVSHLVIFFKLTLPVTCREVQLKLQRSEVEASAWIDFTQIKKILSRDDDSKETAIEHSTLIKANQDVQGEVKLGSLYPFYPNEFGEGVVGAARLILEDLVAQNEQN